MREFNKLFGIGMSKTGTTTLAECLKILDLGPHKSFDAQLRRRYLRGKPIEPILEVAAGYRTFEDSPWYMLYRELDQRYPGSLFILTVRKDSLTHAKSSWAHRVRAGAFRGGPSPEYISKNSRIYEEHNRGVMEYFEDRPADLLVLCWERGDGWEELCRFLDAEVPEVPIPRANVGHYGSQRAWLRRLEDSRFGLLARRLRYRLVHAALWLRALVRRSA